jgi:hypothetical protein
VATQQFAGELGIEKLTRDGIDAFYKERHPGCSDMKENIT